MYSIPVLNHNKPFKNLLPECSGPGSLLSEAVLFNSFLLLGTNRSLYDMSYNEMLQINE